MTELVKSANNNQLEFKHLTIEQPSSSALLIPNPKRLLSELTPSQKDSHEDESLYSKMGGGTGEKYYNFE